MQKQNENEITEDVACRDETSEKKFIILASLLAVLVQSRCSHKLRQWLHAITQKTIEQISTKPGQIQDWFLLTFFNSAWVFLRKWWMKLKNSAVSMWLVSQIRPEYKSESSEFKRFI